MQKIVMLSFKNRFLQSFADDEFLSSGVGMKIHEKILTHYLSCTSPVDKEGYLFKKVRKITELEIVHVIENLIILPCCFTERAKCHLPAAVVFPEGKPAFLPGATG